MFSAQFGVPGKWLPGAVVSFEVHENNFVFSTIDTANGAFFSSNPHFGNFALNKDSALPDGYDAEITYYPYPPGLLGSREVGTWSLKNTSLPPVPEPATYGVMGSLFLFGLAAAKKFKNKLVEGKHTL